MMTSFDQLLLRTSRTFGLTIPLLDEPLRRQLTLAYLLFRVADTLEDAEGVTAAVKHGALRQLGDLLQTGQSRAELVQDLAARWLVLSPSPHEGYCELLNHTPDLLAEIEEQPPPVRELILRHARRTIEGMQSFVTRADDHGGLQLDTIVELQAYCYAVAGIVGELITELFVLQVPRLSECADELRVDGRWFGEGLQLVNILKDAEADAAQGRCYLPRSVPRQDILALAESDLRRADRYVARLESVRAPLGMIPFARLPLLLARRTLTRVAELGPGAKLTRSEVATILVEATAGFE